MGEEIRQGRFEAGDFARFHERLRRETELLGLWFQEAREEPAAESAGFELELCLVDEAQCPAPENQSLLRALHDPHWVSELSRFNVELNSDPHPVGPALLSQIREELDAVWSAAEAEAERRRLHLLMIGILPTLPESELTLKNMSPLRRYRVLNEQIFRLREGAPLRLDIAGRERLVTEHEDVMLEAAATSLQVHLQIPLAKATRFYNAAMVASAPLVALAANSPYLFGKDLWSETRIPLFEQAVGLTAAETSVREPAGRVNFGSGYCRNSLYDCFVENLERYPVMLPVSLDGAPEQFPHLRMHNGTIWRWNRPIVAPDDAGKIHLRIEHRVMAAGPSVPDVVANIAAFLGLVHALAEAPAAPEDRLSFTAARENFYAAAREGLDAEIEWLDGKRISVGELWRQELLSRVREGLNLLRVDPEDLAYYVEEVLGGRLKKDRNGAEWQRAFIARHGRDFPALVAAYGERLGAGRPVHEWKL